MDTKKKTKMKEEKKTVTKTAKDIKTPKTKTTRKTKKNFDKLALSTHKKLKGKLEVIGKGHLKTKDDWSTFYTPGVGAVSAYIAKHKDEAKKYTIKANTVAVISDGSAVLGLGNLGAEAALPVMEGKCLIFKEMAGVDAFPIVLGVQNTEEIISAIKAIAPTFGGINLEDISAPKCFEIEERLKKELNIPVMHDDQHGTAIVALAGLINAAKVVGKKMEDLKVVVVGAGAAGRAITLLFLQAGISNIIMTDSKGIIYKGRSGLDVYKQHLAEVTNKEGKQGDVLKAAEGADVIVGVSGPGTIAKAHIEVMSEKAIVFTMANPIPEIMPEDALRAGAAVVATGRSDFPNQINNALAFPGIFLGALKNGVNSITDEMKIAAAKKIANLVKKPTADNIVPSVTAEGLAKVVASAIKR